MRNDTADKRSIIREMIPCSGVELQCLSQSVSQPPYLRGRGQLLFFTSGRYSSQMGAAAYGYLVVGKAFDRDSSSMKRY